MANTRQEVTGVKPTKEDRKKFDIDLEYGEIREDKIKDMLTGKKIEVKSEKGMWMKTGNICIEYESWNKPSGIRATESDYWFHNLCVGDNDLLNDVSQLPDNITDCRGFGDETDVAH